MVINLNNAMFENVRFLENCQQSGFPPPPPRTLLSHYFTHVSAMVNVLRTTVTRLYSSIQFKTSSKDCNIVGLSSQQDRLHRMRWDNPRVVNKLAIRHVLTYRIVSGILYGNNKYFWSYFSVHHVKWRGHDWIYVEYNYWPMLDDSQYCFIIFLNFKQIIVFFLFPTFV